MVIYLCVNNSGNFGKTTSAVQKVSKELRHEGHALICPHVDIRHSGKKSELNWDDCIGEHLEILSRCDAVVKVPGWEKSKKAKAEEKYAQKLGIPIYLYPSVPKKHPTEKRCPKQVRAFMDTIMKMYRVHLSKNADYSPANVIATGEIGLVTRLWDKIARLMNLEGFRFKVESEKLELPSEPKNESIDDTLMDAAVYSIIGILLRRGSWGK
jgi:hypothetical protein